MEARARMPTEHKQVQCDAACYNTNVFAPGAYKVRCDACRGRRGRYDEVEDRWIDCRNCAGTGSVCCLRCHGSGKIELEIVPPTHGQMSNIHRERIDTTSAMGEFSAP